MLKKKEGHKTFLDYDKEILEHSPAGILRLDEKLRIVYENPNIKKILGAPSSEESKAMGIDIRDLSWLKKTGLANKFNNLLEGKEISMDTPFTSMYGKKSFIKVIGVPIFEGDKFAGAALLVTDISEHKKVEEKLRESEKRFSDVAANTGEWIWEVDAEGRYTYSSPVIEQVLGYNAEEVLGKFFYEFFHPDEREQLKSAAFEVFKRKESFVRFVNRNIHKNGHTVILETSGTPIIHAKGKLIGYRGANRDITEYKKAEEALKESEEKFRALAEQSPNMIFINKKGRVLYANKKCEEIMGYKREGFYSPDFDFFTLIAPESRDLVKTNFSRHMKDEEVAPYKYTLITKEGKRIEAIITPKLIRYGTDSAILGIITDITERKKMEKERKHLEERLSALNIYGRSLNKAKSMQESYTLTLKAMERTLGFEYASILMVERKMLRLVSHLGYSKQFSLNLPLDGEKGVTVKATRTRKPVFVSDVKREKAYVLGRSDMLSELAVPIKIGNKVLGVLNVESERLAAFDEEDKKLLEILASHAAIAITNLRRRDQLRKLSNKMKYLMKSTTKIMHVEEMNRRLKEIAKAIRKFGWRRVVISLRDENLGGTDLVTAGLTKEEIKLLLERKASGHVWRERLGPKFERFKMNEFYYLPWSDPWIREYVHRVPPEASLEDATTYAGVPSRLPPEEMVDWHPQDMIYAPLRTPEGRIVGILSMDDPLDGRMPTRESLVPLGLFLHQAAMVIENAQLIESLKKARKQLEAYAEQLEQKVKERTRELKKSQEQLLEVQRLAVIGETAGMVGHDLRNPLTSIVGAAYYLKKRLGSKIDGKVKEMLELIEKNIVYSNKIINDLLDYSGEIKLDLTEVKPKSIIREALSLVEIPKNVQVIDLTENKQKIKVDLGRMKRAFVNIIKNAVEAMSKGGTLTIKTKKLDGTLEFVFSDTGVGMSKKTLEKLWTPLFTTKAKGMGFGLAICKRTLEAHEGSISVKSARGKGTTFTITVQLNQK